MQKYKLSYAMNLQRCESIHYCCRYNPLAGMPFGGLGVSKATPLEVATPTALPLLPSGRGDDSPKALAVFLNSRGEVTAYDAKGHQHWQVD